MEPDDLVVFEIHYHNRIGENYFARPADRHQWFAYPRMTRDEILLIKQWDSAGALAGSNGAFGDASNPQTPATFSFHTAYHAVDGSEHAPRRQSIEVPCIAIYG